MLKLLLKTLKKIGFGFPIIQKTPKNQSLEPLEYQLPAEPQETLPEPLVAETLIGTSVAEPFNERSAAEDSDVEAEISIDNSLSKSNINDTQQQQQKRRRSSSSSGSSRNYSNNQLQGLPVNARNALLAHKAQRKEKRKRKFPFSSGDTPSKKVKRKNKEMEKLRKLKRVLSDIIEEGGLTQNIGHNGQIGQIERFEGKNIDSYYQRVLVTKFNSYELNERLFKVYKLHVCMEAWRRFKEEDPTINNYLMSFLGTNQFQTFQRMLYIGRKLTCISEWLDRDGIELCRLPEVLDIDFEELTMAQVSSVFKR